MKLVSLHMLRMEQEREGLNEGRIDEVDLRNEMRWAKRAVCGFTRCAELTE